MIDVVIDVELTRAVTIAGYLAVVVAAVAIDVAARRGVGRLEPLGDTIAAAMGDRTIRIAVVATWWWIGWHFLADPTRSYGL